MRSTAFLATVFALFTVSRLFSAELYPGDRTKDSGPAIVEYIQQGKPLPAGTFYVSSTLDTGIGVGGALIGNGATDGARNDGAWKHGPVTAIVDARDRSTTEPLLRIRRGRFRICDVGLIGCIVHNYATDKGMGPLVEITQQGAQWAVGQTLFERVSLTNSEIGVYFAPLAGSGGHGDHTTAQLMTHTVDFPYMINENQSVNHQLDLLCKGDGHTIICAKDGGKVYARIHTNGHWQRWLTVGDAEQKTSPDEQQRFLFPYYGC